MIDLFFEILRCYYTNYLKVCCETCGKVVQVAKLKEHNLIHVRANSKVDDASLYDHCDRCGKRFASKQVWLINELNN